MKKLLPVFVCTIASVPLAAQSVVAPAEAKETVVLSPFILSEGKDSGYRSTQSLGGSRLNTDYKDIAVRLEVMTADFLSDLGAFTAEQALNYSGNTESPTESWAVGAGTGDGFLGTSTASMVPSRTRGLGRTTPTRNYFPTVLPYDAYNSYERGLTIASGPNPGLFALGNASGITNTDHNRAKLRDQSGAVRAVVDNFGSVRTDLDYNVPLLPARLALRLNGLLSDRKYPFQGNFANDRRLTAAVGWAPRSWATLDLYAERIDRTTSVPYYSLPTDAVTPWTNPGIGNRRPFTTPDVSPDAPARGNVPGNNTYFYNWLGGAGDPPVYAFGGRAPAGVYSYRYSAGVSTLGRYANQVLGLVAPTFIPSLQDESVYPFKRYGLFGTSRPSVLRGDSVTAVGNFRLARDLYLEAAGNYQGLLEKNATLYSPADIALYIDPNLYGYPAGYTPLDPITANAAQAANRATNQARRGLNPNFGALYIDGTEAAILKDATERQGRLAVAYEVIPRQRWALGRWAEALFARQRLLGTYAVRDSTYISQRRSRLILDNVDAATGAVSTPAVITAANAKAGQSRYMVAANRIFRTRQYLDPADPGRATGQLPFAAFETWNFADDGTGKPFRVGLVPANVGTGARALTQSTAFVYQGNLLRDRVVVTYTRSYDRVATKQFDPIRNVTAAETGLAPDYHDVPWTRFASAPRFVNTSYAVVWHARDWLSLHYHAATNVDPTPPTSHNIDGALNPFSKGDNHEYGIRFRYLGVGLAISRYETQQTDVDVPNVFGQTGFLLPCDRLEARYLTLQRARTQAAGLPDYDEYYAKSGGNPGYNPLDNVVGSAFYRLYGDNLAKGTEVELSGRLGRLDLRFTAAKTNSVKSNIGLGWMKYVTDPAMFQRMENLEWYAFDGVAGQYRPVVGVAGGNVPVFGASGARAIRGWENIPFADTTGSVSLANYYRQTVLPGALLVQKQTGSSNLLMREWRYNGTVAGNLGRKWRAGLSIRQRARAIVGYLNDTATVQIAGNPVSTLVSDLNRPIYSREQWYFDPFVSFRGKLNSRFDFQVQLNVYNATNVQDMDLVAVYASTASRLDVNDPRFLAYAWKDPQSLPLTVRVQDPISFQLTVKFGF